MKTLLTFFVLFFSYSVLAEDISDFQIEGMSIGDSLLDYFSEEKILKNKINYTFNNNKFYAIDLDKMSFLNVYDGGELYLKTNDKKYIIYSIVGALTYKKNINDCYEKKDEIVDVLSKIFIDAKKIDYGTYNHPDDKSGKSKGTSVWFNFKSGAGASVYCIDWSKEIESERIWIDHLRVSVYSKEYQYWLNNEAY